MRFYVNYLPELFGFVIFRYLVDAKWFKQWKKYVGYDDWDKTFVGEKDVYPGPVDNSPLLKGRYTRALRKSFFIWFQSFKKLSFLCYIKIRDLFLIFNDFGFQDTPTVYVIHISFITRIYLT